MGLAVAISITAIGLTTGIIWAIEISKKNNMLDYITASASPDFDKLYKEED